VFNVNSGSVMAQETWLTEKFWIEDAAAAMTCGMTLPVLMLTPPVATVQACRLAGCS
jgi:hypothetical protein